MSEVKFLMMFLIGLAILVSFSNLFKPFVNEEILTVISVIVYMAWYAMLSYYWGRKQ